MLALFRQPPAKRIIWGWARYFSSVCSKKTYAKLDYLVYNKLRSWARHRHAKKSMKWIYQHYWRKTDGPKAFTLVGSSYRLRYHAEMPIRRHIKVKGRRSLYDGDFIYWSSRLGRHPEIPITIAKLLKLQKGHCQWCKAYFKAGDLLEIDHITARSKGGQDVFANKQLLHRHCHDKKTAWEGQSSVGKDKPQKSEEPDERKRSRPVLEPNAESDFVV